MTKTIQSSPIETEPVKHELPKEVEEIRALLQEDIASFGEEIQANSGDWNGSSRSVSGMTSNAEELRRAKLAGYDAAYMAGSGPGRYDLRDAHEKHRAKQDDLKVGMRAAQSLHLGLASASLSELRARYEDQLERALAGEKVVEDAQSRIGDGFRDAYVTANDAKERLLAVDWAERKMAATQDDENSVEK